MEWPAHLPLVRGGGVSRPITIPIGSDYISHFVSLLSHPQPVGVLKTLVFVRPEKFQFLE